MSRTFQEPGNRRDREALYRRNAKIQRERDKLLAERENRTWTQAAQMLRETTLTGETS